ncbi:DNA-binding protein HU |uniref:DNA-binding protein HU \
MTKAEFIELMQEVGDYKTKTEAEKAIKAFTGAITKALVDKKSISLIGFGTFSTVEVAEKSGKVPGKDTTYTKPAHTAPKFKIGKTLKDAVANAK